MQHRYASLCGEDVISDVTKTAVNTDKDGHLTKAFQAEKNMTLQVNC